MNKQLILGAALLLSASPDWANSQTSATTGTAKNDERDLKVFDPSKSESKDSISKDIRNDGTVNGPILQDESEREEELFDEIDNQDGIDRQDPGGAKAQKSKD